MEPSRPALVLENFPSFAELALISSWNDATAARQVRFQRNSALDDRLRSFPPPMSEAEIAALITSRANDNATPQKRWGLFTRKQPVDAQRLEEREPKTSIPNRSQKFLDIGKAARPTTNLNEAVNAGAQKISRSARFAPCEATASTTAPKRYTYAPVDQLAFASAPTHPIDAPVDEIDEVSQALGIDMSDGGIYLTIDPDFRSSRGEAVLTFLSPIPHETSLHLPSTAF